MVGAVGVLRGAMGATVTNWNCSEVRYEVSRVGRRSSGRRCESRLKAERKGSRTTDGVWQPSLADHRPLFAAFLRSCSKRTVKKILTGLLLSKPGVRCEV